MVAPITLGVLSPYPEFTQYVKETGRELSINLKIAEQIFTKGLELAREWERLHEVDAFISRGYTSWMLKKELTLPVISVEISNYEVLKTLFQAKRSGAPEPYAVVDFKYRSSELDIKAITEVLGVSFSMVTYENEYDLLEQLKAAVHRGIRTVAVTGEMVIRMAAECGLKSICIRRDPTAIQGAIEDAIRISFLKRETDKFFSSLHPIFASTLEAIVVVDNQGFVQFVNGSAQKILGLKALDLEGTMLAKLPGWGDIVDPKASAFKREGKSIIQHGEKKIVVTRLNSSVHDLTQGAIFILRQISATGLEVKFDISQNCLNKRLTAKFFFDDLVGESTAITEAKEIAKRYSRSEGTVLITGESGTGKELFAQSIHNASNRNRGPFVAVNCSAVSESLLESELFGYDPGAFTGARRGGKVGLFELANGGTIFLDEVEAINQSVQVRLLRVLQEREIMRVGGETVVPINIRVVAATNQELDYLVQRGLFRQDLFYRLKVLPLYLPPLKQRLEDVLLLFKYFIGNHYCPSDEELEVLLAYDWPGNVREVQNLASRYLALGGGRGKDSSLFFRLVKDMVKGVSVENKLPSTLTVRISDWEDMQNDLLNQLFNLYKNKNQTEISKLLGLSRTTLWRRFRQGYLKES